MVVPNQSKMSRKIGDRFKFSSVRDKLTISRERKTSQSLKVRSTNPEKMKLNSSLPDISSIESATKHSLYMDGDVQVNTGNVFSESVQYFGSMRSWKSHHITLGSDEITLLTSSGTLTTAIQYSSIDKIAGIELTKGPNNCIEIKSNRKSVFLQAPDPYQRNRLLNSLKWRLKVYKSKKVLFNATQATAIISELQFLVALTVDYPLLIDDTHRILLEIASKVLSLKSEVLNEVSREAIIMALAPLVENNQPSIEICSFFTKHCRQSPRSVIVVNMFTPIVQQILKNTFDFGKSTWLRTFIVEYIQALNSQNNGLEVVGSFIQTMHGPLSQCPHTRIHNNLIAVCLSAIYQYFSCGTDEGEEKHRGKKKQHLEKLPGKTFTVTEKNILNNSKSHAGDAKNMKNCLAESMNKQTNQPTDVKPLNTDHHHSRGDVNFKEYYQGNEKRSSTSPHDQASNEISAEDFESVRLFVHVLLEIAKIYDWRPGLAGLLQPLPFPEEAMKRKDFARLMYPVIECFAGDDRESVVTCLLHTREGKDGWVQVFSPGGNLCQDDGLLFSKMVEALMKPGIQAGKMKKFLRMLATTELQVIIMLALRENPVMIQVLRDMLQFGILANELEQLQVVSVLRCTPTGNRAYEDLRSLLSVFTQNDGPKEFTLAPNSTDEDLTTLLSAGSWGNLEKLDLSFTHVTQKIVSLLVLLPNLKHLNLWATNMNDAGLQALCDSSINLQSLNLCETRVTDDGIACLEVMTNLERLNLNSTAVSCNTFHQLKKSFPNLKEWDVTYTDAWPDNK